VFGQTTAAIIGCGDVSIIHTEALADMDEATLVGVCDPDADRRAAAELAHRVPRSPII
jgi:UDP-N-acetyl-2-amino-2-deoxyglucuronate dehydrogenase